MTEYMMTGAVPGPTQLPDQPPRNDKGKAPSEDTARALTGKSVVNGTSFGESKVSLCANI